jgi:hypothetical protein
MSQRLYLRRPLARAAHEGIGAPQIVMNNSRSFRILFVVVLLVTTFYWGSLAVQSAQASSEADSSGLPQASGNALSNLVVTIDPVQAFSSSEGAVYLTGTVDCPVDSRFSLEARVAQPGSGGSVVTDTATGRTVTTRPGGQFSTADGSSGRLPCGGVGTQWFVVAAYNASASFSAGPAEVCVRASIPRSYPTTLCQTVELIGG